MPGNWPAWFGGRPRGKGPAQGGHLAARPTQWKATWSLHPEADPAAEQWVRRQALAVLNGNALQVARAIRRKATKATMSPTQRKGADEAANYLTSKAPYLDYPTALTGGWPIATGVIEGAVHSTDLTIALERRAVAINSHDGKRGGGNPLKLWRLRLM